MAVDETCPVCRTAEVVCGKWTLLLVRDLAEGRSRFCELERSLAGISPRTLSLRLRALEEEGIVERHTYPEVPPRVEYALTEKGMALLPIIEDMRSYGERWLGLDCEDAVKTALAVAVRAASPRRAPGGPGRASGVARNARCVEQEGHRARRSEPTVRSLQLQAALSDFAEQAAERLHADVLAGHEVGFELESHSPRVRGASPLYCYRPLTRAFIAERFGELRRLARIPQSG